MAAQLSPAEASAVKAPILEESPISLECKVKEIKRLGSHDMFIAEVVNVQADERYMDPTTGAFDLRKANPLAYAHGKYYELGELVGKFGWSVQKRKKS